MNTEYLKNIFKKETGLDVSSGVMTYSKSYVNWLEKQLLTQRVVSSAMYKATFSFFKENPRGGRGQWCTEIVPLESKNETDLKEKIATYLKDDHNSYHKHIKLKDIELM